ncbi:MAG: protein kinase [Cyanobacteriota/Melainabacteria group bacterium]
MFVCAVRSIIGKGRKGSLLQYIFRLRTLRLSTAAYLVELEQETEDPSALSKKAGKSIEEAELELDPAKFPLDRYIPLLELGRGASGRVYLARDRRLQKRVAIKVLTSSDQNQLLAFQEEAKNTSRLNNPYIVRILDFGIAGGSYPYMVLEYLQGISLEDYLKEHGPLAPDAAASIFVQLCLA